jgi:small-conductance mechanosensitive channel
LRQTQEHITRDEAQIKKLEITREQEELASNTHAIRQIDASLKELRSNLQQETFELLAYTYQLFAYDVLNKKPDAFQKSKDLIALIDRYHILTRDETAAYIQPLLLELEKTYLGRLKTLTGSSKAEVENVLFQTWQFANQPLFSIGQTPISLFKLLMSVLIFVLGFFAGGQYKKRINRLTANRSSFTSSTRTLLANLGYYAIITIAFFIGLNILGVKLSSIALVAGALSVGIGFGLQNIVSNFISGLILMFERSIKIGDYIEVDEHTQGYVTDIRMRSTTVTTNENIDIIIPNQDFIQKNVVNWTMNDNIRRFGVPFGVRYGTQPEEVIRVVLEAVRNSGLMNDIYESATRKTSVIMTEMADSSVNFELYVWVRGDKLHRPRRTRSEFLILIYNALYANGIEIPFPQQDIHIRSIDSDIPVHIHSDR